MDGNSNESSPFIRQAFTALGLNDKRNMRQFSKAPLMIFQYGAGRALIKRIVKENILIADTELDFAKKIVWCFENPIESEIIGRNAKINIQENYNSLTTSNKLDKFLNKIQTV